MTQLVLSLFPGIGLIDLAFELEWPEVCIVRGPDLIFNGHSDIRRFHPPAGRFDGVIGSRPILKPLLQAAFRRWPGAAECVGNLVYCEALRMQSAGIIFRDIGPVRCAADQFRPLFFNGGWRDVPSFLVKGQMRCPINYLQVLYMIVVLHAVLVVDILRVLEFTAEVLRHDAPVLKDPSAIDVDLDVASLRALAATATIEVIGAAESFLRPHLDTCPNKASPKSLPRDVEHGGNFLNGAPAFVHDNGIRQLGIC